MMNPENTNQAMPTTAGGGLFDVKKILHEALRFWYLFVITLLVCVGYAWFKIHYATPMYKVYGKLLVQSDKGGGGQAQALSGGGMDISTLFSSSVNMQNEIAILQTTDLCKKVVDAQTLNVLYYNNGEIRQVELYDGSPVQVDYHYANGQVQPISFIIEFDGLHAQDFDLIIGKQTRRWHFNDSLRLNGNAYYFRQKDPGAVLPKSAYTIVIQDPYQTANAIAGNLTADLLGTKSTILALSYNTNIPRKGINVLAGVMQAYINRNLDQKNLISDSTIQFINRRLVLVGDNLNEIENTIQQFREKNKIIDLTVQGSNLASQGLDVYNKTNGLDVQLEIIATMLRYIEDEGNNTRPVPAFLTSDPTFSGLLGSYNDAQVQRDKLLLTLKPDNPIIANLNNQLSELRRSMVKSLESQQRALAISKQDLRNQNSQVEQGIQKLPAQQRQFLDYTREQDLRQQLYLFLLQKREEVAIAKAANSSNASVVSAPVASGIPYEPVSTTFYTIAILLGFLLPSLFVFVKVMANNKVISREDITNATPVSILAEIGHNKLNNLINLTEEGRSMIAEQFRIFRTNMEFAISGEQNPVILITSTMSGEGKSFIAANLGQIYAVSGKRVLLMELDLRKPKLSESLGVVNTAGFSNYIVSQEPAERFIQPLPSISPNLFIMGSGPIPPNPAELLVSPKTKLLMEELKTKYDVIIVDTAPIGAVTDAQILSSLATVNLYILRQNYTLKGSFGVINDLALNSKMKPLYLIVNDVTGGSSYRYGYGYGYGYGYKGGYYKSESPQSKKK